MERSVSKPINLEDFYDWCATVSNKERIVYYAELKANMDASTDALKNANTRLGVCLTMINLVIGNIFPEYKIVAAVILSLSAGYFLCQLGKMEQEIGIVRKDGLKYMTVIEEFKK